jgi:hypothetical protein
MRVWTSIKSSSPLDAQRFEEFRTLLDVPTAPTTPDAGFEGLMAVRCALGRRGRCTHLAF